MRCSLIDKDFNNPYESVHTAKGEPSVLYGQLYSSLKTTEGDIVDKVAAEKAYNAYKIIESEQFQEWFRESRSGHNVNSQGEPRLFGNSYSSEIVGKPQFWYMLDSNRTTATKSYPLGLKRISGLSPDQIIEGVDVLFAEVLKNKTYTVQDFEDASKINFDSLVFFIGKKTLQFNSELLKSIGAPQNNNPVGAGTKYLYAEMFKDLVAHDPITGKPIVSGGRLVLNPKSKFLDMVIRKIVAGGRLKNQINEEDKAMNLNIAPAHFSNPKESASANTKLLIQSLYVAQWEDDPGTPVLRKSATLGQPILVNAVKVYAKLQTYLSNIHPTTQNPDVFTAMMDRIKSMAKYHAEFVELIDILEDPATPEYKRTQFVQAFYRPSLDYSTTFVVNRSNVETKVGSPDTQSNENDILDRWQLNFEDKLITTNRNNEKVLDLDKAIAAYEAFDSFLVDFGKAQRANRSIEPFKKRFIEVLNKIGIEFSPEALNFYLMSNTVKNEETGLSDITPAFNLLVDSLQYVYEKSKSPKSVTISNLIAKAENAKKRQQNKPVLEDELGDVKSFITDESGVKGLAISEAVFKEDLIDSTVLGPGGDLYWKYGLYSFLHTAVQKLKAGDDTYIQDLAATPYGQNSRWVKWLLDDTRDSDNKLNREKFTLEQFLHMVNETEASQGKKFSELIGPDEFVNSVTRTLSGKFGTIARGNSQTDYTLQGPPLEDSGVEYIDGKIVYQNDNIVKIFKGYIQADLAAQGQAFKDIKKATKDPNKLDMSNMILYYHYKLVNGKPVFFDENGYPTGNVFKADTMVFPELGYNPNEKGQPTGLVKNLYRTTKANRGNPYTVTEEMLNDPAIEKLIKDRFEIIFEKNLEKAEKYKVFGVNQIEGTIYNRGIDYKLINKYEETVGDQKAARALGDYVLNAMIANQESMMLFVGQPAMFKSVEEIAKRSNHFTTPVAKLRIYKNANNKWEVNPHYLHATVADIEVPSEVLEDPRFEARVGKEIASLWKKVDIADGSTWVSPNLYRQRERGLGRWPDARNEAFERIMNGTATAEDYKKAMFTPIKGTVRGMDVKGGLNVPRIEKTAYMPLWPALVNTTNMQAVYDDMLKREKEYKDKTGQEIGSQVAVLSAVKLGVNTVTSINDGANLSYQPGSLEFTEENHSLWGLAQDIPTKGFKPTIVGSQAKINIQANVNPDGMYGSLSGTEWLEETHRVERALSDIGLEEFAEEFGIEVYLDSHGNRLGEIVDKTKFNERFVEKFLEEDKMNIVEGIEAGVPLDAIFHDRSKIQSIVTNGIKNKTVLYKSMGGQFAQMTSFGLGLNSDRYADLKKSERSRIKWLVPESRLKAPRLDAVNKKVLPGQILLPYKFVKKIKGFENMTDEQLKENIDPKALQILGYRIPNQSIASMDSLEIVGILPEEVGDTVIVYEDITTKTGSDFDIDKVFFLLPNLRIDGPQYGNTGRLVRVPSNEPTKESLENRRIELWEDVLQSVDSIKQVMYPTDAGFLMDDANEVRKLIEANNPETDERGKDIMLGMKFISPDYQSELRNRFIIGQKMVAAVANNIVDHVLSQQSGFALNTDIGVGNVVNGITFLNAQNMKDSELLISQILSSYMNANVDIEKDPYISYVNFNPNTGNVGFLLLRAGVNYKWVNRFLAQPILRELSSTMYAVQSEALPSQQNMSVFNMAKDQIGREFYPKELEEFEIDPEARIEDVLTVKVLNDLLEQGDKMPGYYAYQEYILNKFEELKETGDEVFSQLISTKVNTKGPGKNLLEAVIMEEKRIQASLNPLFQNYDTKFGDNTTLGAQYNNSVTFLLNTFRKEFLSTSPFMQSSLKAILAATKNKGSIDVDLHTRIVNKMYSYVYSNFFAEMPGYTERLQNLMFNQGGSESFVERFRKMQKSKPNSVLLSLIGSKLNFNVKDDFSKPSYLYARGTKSVPSEVKNIAYREWEAMYLDPETKQFASDLVLVAFASSGFNNTLSSFHTMIPMRWLIDSGFSDRIKTLSSELNPQHNEGMGAASLYSEQMISQIIRHEFDNPEIVPNFSERKGVNNVYRKDFRGKELKISKASALQLSGATQNYAKTFVKSQGGVEILADYVRYFRYDVTENVKQAYQNTSGETKFRTIEKITPMLYEFRGIDPINDKPIYTSVDPLGFKGKEGIKLFEYEFDRNQVESYRKPSIFTKNNTAVERGGKQFKDYLTTLTVPLQYDLLAQYTNPKITCN